MQTKLISVLLLSASILCAGSARSASEFCKSVEMLPLQDIDKTKVAIHKVETVRSSVGSSGNGRSIEDVERLVKPYKLSSRLRQTFVDLVDGADGDYDVYRSPDATLFDFRMVEGSEKCSSDIWVKREGNLLEEAEDEPDLGEACDVVRIFGNYMDRPILMQYAFGDKQALHISEIRAVDLSSSAFETICIIEPRN